MMNQGWVFFFYSFLKKRKSSCRHGCNHHCYYDSNECQTAHENKYITRFSYTLIEIPPALKEHCHTVICGRSVTGILEPWRMAAIPVRVRKDCHPAAQRPIHKWSWLVDEMLNKQTHGKKSFRLTTCTALQTALLSARDTNKTSIVEREFLMLKK